MIDLLSFLFLGVVIIWVYSICADWEVSKKQLIRRSRQLFGYSVGAMIVSEVLIRFFGHY